MRSLVPDGCVGVLSAGSILGSSSSPWSIAAHSVVAPVSRVTQRACASGNDTDGGGDKGRIESSMDRRHAVRLTWWRAEMEPRMLLPTECFGQGAWTLPDRLNPLDALLWRGESDEVLRSPCVIFF